MRTLVLVAALLIGCGDDDGGFAPSPGKFRVIWTIDHTGGCQAGDYVAVTLAPTAGGEALEDRFTCDAGAGLTDVRPIAEYHITAALWNDEGTPDMISDDVPLSADVVVGDFTNSMTDTVELPPVTLTY